MYKKIYRSMCAMAVTTLLSSALIILCVCYTSFCARFTEQVKNECLFASSLLNAGKFTGDALESAVERSASKRISIISKDGSVLYDNNADAFGHGFVAGNKGRFQKRLRRGSKAFKNRRKTLLLLRRKAQRRFGAQNRRTAEHCVIYAGNGVDGGVFCCLFGLSHLGCDSKEADGEYSAAV